MIFEDAAALAPVARPALGHLAEQEAPIAGHDDAFGEARSPLAPAASNSSSASWGETWVSARMPFQTGNPGDVGGSDGCQADQDRDTPAPGMAFQLLKIRHPSLPLPRRSTTRRESCAAS
jgi:hypothetical protein